MNRIDKYLMRFSYILKIVLIIAIIIEIIKFDWISLFLTITTLILTFIPAMLERNYKITLPLEFEFLIVIFIFGTLYLGEVGNYYEKYWWWDTLLHTLSGIILGIIGFIIVYILNTESKISVKMKSIYVAVVSFSFAVSIGAVWEIFEFAMDQFFGLNMQKSGLVDTMWDLIVDVLGALIVSIAGYFYVKKVKTPIFHNFFEKFFYINKNVHKRFKKTIIRKQK